jgi:hypothetical protein
MSFKEVGIKRGNFGRTYQFIVKNVDYSNYEANIFIQSSGGTYLISGADCVVDATDNSKNTIVEFTPASGMFGAKASIADYVAEITFSGARFRDSTDTFTWQVYDEVRGGRYIKHGVR